MATSLRRPLISVIGLSPISPISPLSHRCFSHAAPRWALNMKAQQGQRPPERPERSMRAMQKEAMRALPTEMELLPQTFVPPRRGTYWPPTKALKYTWKRIFFWARDIFTVYYMKFSSPRIPDGNFLNRSVKIRASQLAPTAKAMHQEMYSAFAAGDKGALKKMCCEGIYESFVARINTRPKGERWEWEIVRYHGRVKKLSHRIANAPLAGAFVRQVVVRIGSTQRLTRYDAQGRVVDGTGKEKKVWENVVIQKTYLAWKDGEWLVWGTTNDTGLKILEEWEQEGI